MILKLAEIAGSELVARSQAKRLKKLINENDVIFDFDGVKEIGPAFADELFRVFAADHPAVMITTVNLNEKTKKMVCRAKKVEI